MVTGYKTYILGLAVTLLGVLQTDPNFQALLGTHMGIVTSVIGVLIMVMRTFTTTPPLQSTPATTATTTSTTTTTAPVAAVPTATVAVNSDGSTTTL